MNADMFYNETTGEIKFFREGAARTGLGPEWLAMGQVFLQVTITHPLPGYSAQ